MSGLFRPVLLPTLLARLRLTVRLLRDPAVPLAAKAVPVLAALYLITPLDLMPDVFPILGQIDDLAIALIAVEVFLRICPAGVRAFHQAAEAEGRPYSPITSADDFIDAEWRSE